MLRAHITLQKLEQLNLNSYSLTRLNRCGSWLIFDLRQQKRNKARGKQRASWFQNARTRHLLWNKNQSLPGSTLTLSSPSSAPPASQWKEEANAVSLDSFGPKRSSSWLTVVGPVMAYQLYRNTTLGNSLQESLDELIQVSQAAPLSSIATVLLLRCLLARCETSLCFAGCDSLQPRSVPDKCSTHLRVQHLNHLTSNSSVA